MVLFIYSWVLYRSKCKNALGYLLLGISAGMLCSIRLNTGMFLLIPFLDFLVQAIRGFYERKFSELKLLGRNVLLMVVAYIVVVLPQLVAWGTILGKLLPPASHVSFTLTNIFQNILYVFVGKDWGVFITEPAWIFGLIGLAVFIKMEKRVSIIFSLCLLTSLVICSGFLNEASFGHRFILNCNIILSFGVAALIDSVKMKRKIIVTSCVSLVLIVWNYFLLLLPLLALFLSVILLSVFLRLSRARLEKSVLFLTTFCMVFFIVLDGASLGLHKGKTEGEKYFRYKQAALSSLKRGWPEKALRYLEEAGTLKIDVGDINSYDEKTLNEHLGNTLNAHAIKYYKDNKIQEAIRLFSKAIELDSGSAEIHKNLGALFYYDLKDYQKALLHFQRSLELSPNQEQAETLRGLVGVLKRSGTKDYSK